MKTPLTYKSPKAYTEAMNADNYVYLSPTAVRAMQDPVQQQKLQALLADKRFELLVNTQLAVPSEYKSAQEKTRDRLREISNLTRFQSLGQLKEMGITGASQGQLSEAILAGAHTFVTEEDMSKHTGLKAWLNTTNVAGLWDRYPSMGAGFTID